ncbi:MAG: hypothetical protein R3D46_17945 [Defluviimonas denitrificans]
MRSLKPILSPANLTMGAVGLAYVGAVWALPHPEYFRDVIPLARDVTTAPSRCRRTARSAFSSSPPPPSRPSPSRF